jgi:hypothetical protein
VEADRLPTNVRVVPDLGDELLLVIDRLEALWGAWIWEMEDDVGLPVPFATGRRWVPCRQTVAAVVWPTQGRDEPQLVSGRRSRRGRTGRELPLHFVPIPDARLRRSSTPCRSSLCSGLTTTSKLRSSSSVHCGGCEPPFAGPGTTTSTSGGRQPACTPIRATPSSVAASSKPTTGRRAHRRSLVVPARR